MPARGNTKLPGFYFPWPLRNIQFARQIDQSRENTFKLAPLVRAAYVDPQPVSANDPGNHDLSGWAVGKRDFRNKFRIYYDQQFLRFAIQHNVGTEAEETWDDMIWIRESDGRVSIVQDGGLEAQGGFYNQVPRNLATSGRFQPASSEWAFTHNLNTKPILWDTFNLEDKSIVPQSVDVSDPNIAYFYFATPQAGIAVVTGEQSRFEGIRVSDGDNTFDHATRLGFNEADFYLSNDGHGMPVVNLQPLDLSESDPSTIPVNLRITDTGDSQTFDFSTISTPTIIFNQVDFYFDTNPNGNPIVNIRGGAGGGGSSGQFGTGIFAQDFALSSEWVLNHGLGVINVLWNVYDDQGLAIIPQKVSVHNSNISYFYFTPALAGRAVVGGGPIFQGTVDINVTNGNPSFPSVSNLIFNSLDFYITPDSSGNPIVNLQGITGSGGVTDHGALTGLLNDDHPQYARKAASQITFRGTITAEAFYLTPGSGGEISKQGNDVLIRSNDGIVIIDDDVTITGTLTAPGFGGSSASGFYAKMSDGTPFGETLILATSDFVKTGQVVTINESGVDHSTLANLTVGDPHTQYVLKTQQSPGFYGVVWSDGVVTKKTDRLSFDNSKFYLDGSRPTVNFKDDAYSLISGARPFTGTVGGVTPVAASDLATKNYVDLTVGPGFYGLFIRESDGNPPTYRNDTIIFDSTSFYLNSDSKGKPIVSLRGISGSGSGLQNIVEDTTPQLGGDLDVNDFRITGVGDIVADGPALLTIIGGNDGSGQGGITIQTGLAFYAGADSAGITIQAGVASSQTGKGGDVGIGGGIAVNTGDGGSVILQGGDTNSGTGGSISLTPGISVLGAPGEIFIFGNTNMNGFYIGGLVAPKHGDEAANKAYVDAHTGANPGFYGIFIQETDGTPQAYKKDTIIFDSASFYLNSDSKGRPIVSFRGGVGLTVAESDGNPPNFTAVTKITFHSGGFYLDRDSAGQPTVNLRSNPLSIDDGVRTFNIRSLGFNDKQFYLTGSNNQKAVLNLRDEPDVFQGQIAQPVIENYFVIPTALHDYTVIDAELETDTGTATGGFYIIRQTYAKSQFPGKIIAGMDPISITTKQRRTTAGNTIANPNTINRGDRLVLSLYQTASSSHLVYTVRVKKTN